MLCMLCMVSMGLTSSRSASSAVSPPVSAPSLYKVGAMYLCSSTLSMSPLHGYRNPWTEFPDWNGRYDFAVKTSAYHGLRSASGVS